MNIRRATVDDIPELMRLAGQWLNPLYDREKKKDILFQEITFAKYRITHPIFIVEKEKYEIPIRDIGYIHNVEYIDWNKVDEYKKLYQKNERVHDILVREIKEGETLEGLLKLNNWGWEIKHIKGGNKYLMLDGRHRMLAKMTLGERFIRCGIAESTPSKNQIIGFCGCWLHQDWLTNKLRLAILHIYIDSNYRKLGVGTFLLQEVLRLTNPDFVFVDTKPDKFPYAEALYKKVGLEGNPRRKWLEAYR